MPDQSLSRTNPKAVPMYMTPRQVVQHLKQWELECSCRGLIMCEGCVKTKLLKEVDLLDAQLLRLQQEVERLKRGDFTEPEFQNLCHNFDPSDEARFEQGCLEYQAKLFGRCLLCKKKLAVCEGCGVGWCLVCTTNRVICPGCGQRKEL